MDNYRYALGFSEILNKDSKPILDVIDTILDKFIKKYYKNVPDAQSDDYELKYREVVSLFMEGYCYCFAYMLNKIFEGDSDIWTASIHAITRIKDGFYDAQGNVEAPFTRKQDIRSLVIIDEYSKINIENWDEFVNVCYYEKSPQEIKHVEEICNEIIQEMLLEKKQDVKLKSYRIDE